MNAFFKFSFDKYRSFTLVNFLILSLSLSSDEELSIEDIQELQELKLGENVIKEDEKFLELQKL